MNTKLHTVTDAEGRPIRFFMTASRHPLRQVPEGLHLRRRPRRNRHVLAMKREGFVPLGDLNLKKILISMHNKYRNLLV